MDAEYLESVNMNTQCSHAERRDWIKKHNGD